jgi:hypothetical protein
MTHKCDGCRYKDEYRDGKFRPFGICRRGLNLIEAEKNYNAEKCPYRNTNADQVRAMGDEELADFITEMQRGWCTEIGREVYYQRNLEWLKQPAEGGST